MRILQSADSTTNMKLADRLFDMPGFMEDTGPIEHFRNSKIETNKLKGA